MKTGRQRALRGAPEMGLTLADGGAPDKDQLLCRLELQQTEAALRIEQLGAVQRQLRESRDRFATFYESAPFGYVTFDATACVLDANSTTAALLGVSRARLRQVPFSFFVWPPHFSRFLEHLRRCRAGQQTRVSSELCVRGAGGQAVPVQCMSVAVLEGDRILFHTALIDLTERKRAEGAVAQARDYAESVVQTVPLPLLVLDHKLVVQAANRMFCETFRTAAAQIQGWPVEELPGLSWSAAGLMPILRTTLANGVPVYNFEIVCKLQLQEAQPVFLLNAKRLDRPPEEHPHLLLLFEEITQRKEAEKERERLLGELRLAHADLERRVEERTADLQVTNAQLKKLPERLVEAQEMERRRIARELHDDVGQSLTALKLLLLGQARSTPEEAAETLKEAAQAVADVLEQVRQMSRELRPHVLDDLGLLAALKWHFKTFGARSGVRIRFQCSRLHEALLAPQVKTTVFRIIQEALTNVARHARVQNATVRLRQGPSTVRLEVADKGVGFDPRKMTDSASSGLSSIQEGVALAHGECTIRSNPGGGTSVQVELPIPKPEGRIES